MPRIAERGVVERPVQIHDLRLMLFLGLGLVLIALAVAGVIIELMVRRWLRAGRYFVRRPRAGIRFSPDQTLFAGIEKEIVFGVNEYGERGNPVPKTGNLFRVLIAGGSSVECWFSDQSTNWGAVLEKRLSTPENLGVFGADAVHVGNVGRSGVDVGSLRAILGKILPNYPRLDAIVLMVGASDAVRWMEIGGPPDRPVQMLTTAEAFDQNPERPFVWSVRQSGLAEVIRRFEPWLRRGPKNARGGGTWLHRARKMRGEATTLRHDPGDSRIVLEVYDRNFRELVALCKAKAPRVIIARQPWFQKDAFTPEEQALFWHGGVGKAFKATVSEFYSDAALFKLMGEIDAQSARVAEEMGVDQIDVRNGIEMSAQNFYDHFHFTPAGCGAVGELVAQAMIETEQASTRIPEQRSKRLA